MSKISGQLLTSVQSQDNWEPSDSYVGIRSRL